MKPGALAPSDEDQSAAVTDDALKTTKRTLRRWTTRPQSLPLVRIFG